jgi:asparagine synthetase B (glutamine-hydrolysing)
MQNNINLCESNKELDNLILDFLLFGAPLGEKYFYDKNIKQELINYFKEPRLSYKKEGGEIIHDIDTLLHNYINENFKIIKGTDKIGILLSGGIDSANILSYLSKYQYNIFAYTWGGGDQKALMFYFRNLAQRNLMLVITN